MKKPKIYYNVSQTQLSIARHYGRAIIGGEEYIYDHRNDTLIEKKGMTKKQINEIEKDYWTQVKKQKFEEMAK